MLISKIIVLHPNGWLCSEDVTTDTDVNMIRDESGKAIEAKHTNYVILSHRFEAKGKVSQSDQVECIAIEGVGNKIHFKGLIDDTEKQLKIRMISATSPDGVSEIVDKIKNLN